MPQPQTAPQYLDDNGDPIGAPSSAPALTYLDDQGNPSDPTKPVSVAEQARRRLKARGLTPEDVKSGQGVTPNDFSTMGELQNPANFPTTKEVLSSVGEHALGAVKQLVPHMPTSAADAAFSAVDPSGTIRGTVDAIRGVPDAYRSEVQRGNNPVVAGMRAAATLAPGGSTLNALTEPVEAVAHGRPVSKQENVDAAGGVGDIAGQAAIIATAHKIATRAGVPSLSKTQTLDAMDANLGNDAIGSPAKPPYDTTPHGDVVNRAIGPGAINSKRGVNVGKAFVDAGMEIDPAEVKKNPRTLVAHTNKVIAAENLAADQILASPEAQAPSVNGAALNKGIGGDVALESPADVRAANSIHRYVDRRIAELSAKHGGDGMISVADADTIKRELQKRTNYDKVFGNTALTSSDNLRNQLRSEYAGRFDSVGDTLPDYRELNDRRASLVNFRDNVLHPIIDAKIDGSNAKPSKLGAVVRLGSAAVRTNAFDAIKAGGDLAASSAPTTDPFRIAKAINQQVRAAKTAGFESPTARILAGAQVTEPPAAATPTEIPGSAQFAGSDQGDVFPVDKRPGAVASSFQPSGTTSGLGWAPSESPSVHAASLMSAEASAAAQRNPGFDPARLPVKPSGAPPVTPPVSHIDLANTLRGVSSSPSELRPSLLESSRSSAPGQIGDLVERAGTAQGLATQIRQAARNQPAGVSAPALQPLPDADIRAALDAQRAKDAALAARRVPGGTAPANGKPPLLERASGRPDAEWPKSGTANENDALLLKTRPSLLLPDRFTNARQVLYGSPLSGQIADAPSSLGLYGTQFKPGPESGRMGDQYDNTIQIARKASDATDVYTHETGHAVYEKDLTDAERAQWKNVYDGVWGQLRQKVAEAGVRRTDPDASAKIAKIAQQFPRAIIEYRGGSSKEQGGTGYQESFSELFGQYMANPSAFRATYPGVYGYFRNLIGQEYIQAKR